MMMVITRILYDGSVVCETTCGTRHYRSRYSGYTKEQAENAFIKRVINEEQEELDKARLLALAEYLNDKEKRG